MKPPVLVRDGPRTYSLHAREREKLLYAHIGCNGVGRGPSSPTRPASASFPTEMTLLAERSLRGKKSIPAR
jgi:hypothetical protein